MRAVTHPNQAPMKIPSVNGGYFRDRVETLTAKEVS